MATFDFNFLRFKKKNGQIMIANNVIDMKDNRNTKGIDSIHTVP